MTRVLAIALVVVCSVVTLAAQAAPARNLPPKSELFVGYSYLFRDYRHTQLNPVTGGMNGWDASYATPTLFGRHFGLTVDASGHYASGGFFTPQIYFLTAGPLYSASIGRSMVFVHGLVGAKFATSDVIAQTSSDTTALFGGGGGLDYPVTHRVDWRANFDWFYGGFKTNDTNQISDIVDSNFRFSTGPVLHF